MRTTISILVAMVLLTLGLVAAADIEGADPCAQTAYVYLQGNQTTIAAQPVPSSTTIMASTYVDWGTGPSCAQPTAASLSTRVRSPAIGLDQTIVTSLPQPTDTGAQTPVMLTIDLPAIATATTPIAVECETTFDVAFGPGVGSGTRTASSSSTINVLPEGPLGGSVFDCEWVLPPGGEFVVPRGSSIVVPGFLANNSDTNAMLVTGTYTVRVASSSPGGVDPDGVAVPLSLTGDQCRVVEIVSGREAVDIFSSSPPVEFDTPIAMEASVLQAEGLSPFGFALGIAADGTAGAAIEVECNITFEELAGAFTNPDPIDVSAKFFVRVADGPPVGGMTITDRVDVGPGIRWHLGPLNVDLADGTSVQFHADPEPGVTFRNPSHTLEVIGAGLQGGGGAEATSTDTIQVSSRPVGFSYAGSAEIGFGVSVFAHNDFTIQLSDDFTERVFPWVFIPQKPSNYVISLNDRLNLIALLNPVDGEVLYEDDDLVFSLFGGPNGERYATDITRTITFEDASEESIEVVPPFLGGLIRPDLRDFQPTIFDALLSLGLRIDDLGLLADEPRHIDGRFYAPILEASVDEQFDAVIDQQPGRGRVQHRLEVSPFSLAPVTPGGAISRFQLVADGATSGSLISINRTPVGDAPPAADVVSVKYTDKASRPEGGKAVVQTRMTFDLGDDPVSKRREPLPASCRDVLLDFGGHITRLTLDEKGRGRSVDKRRSIRAKIRTDRDGQMTVTLKCKLKKLDLARHLIDDGLVDATIKKPGIELTIPIRVLWCGTLYVGEARVNYRAKAGRKGKAKLIR